MSVLVDCHRDDMSVLVDCDRDDMSVLVDGHVSSCRLSTVTGMTCQFSCCRLSTGMTCQFL